MQPDFEEAIGSFEQAMRKTREAVAAGPDEAAAAAIAQLSEKVASTSAQPPMMLDTTGQGRLVDKPKWNTNEWAQRRRKRKAAQQSKRRQRR